MPLHECFHVPVTSCQRAEVKRVLHCDATTRADMNVFSSDTFYCRDIFTPTTTNLHYKIHLLLIILHRKSFSFKVCFHQSVHLIILPFTCTISKWFDPEGLSSTGVSEMNFKIQTFFLKDSIQFNYIIK